VNAAHLPHRLARLACALLLAGVSISYAQNARRVQSVPQPAAPANAATLGLPRPAGLPSRFPAGLPETGIMGSSGTPLGTPPASTNTISPGGTVTVPDTGSTAGSTPTPNPTVTGNGTNAGGVTYLGAAAPQGPVSGPAGNFTPLQVAQSFLGADANHDGELTRGEFQYLTIKPYAFEEMDADHDGVVSRSEYETAVRGR
jgi:hypothetical protein